MNKYPLTMRHPMMLEQSIHHLDLIRYCYGREVEAVACRTWNPPWSVYAHDANVSCLLTLEGGLEVNYFGTWTGGWNELKFEWRTDCEARRDRPAGAVLRPRDGAHGGQGADPGAACRIACPSSTTRGRCSTHFAAALRGDGECALHGRGTTCKSLALCFAAIEVERDRTPCRARRFRPSGTG